MLEAGRPVVPVEDAKGDQGSWYSNRQRAVDYFRLVATDAGPSRTTLADSGFSLLEMEV